MCKNSSNSFIQELFQDIDPGKNRWLQVVELGRKQIICSTNLWKVNRIIFEQLNQTNQNNLMIGIRKKFPIKERDKNNISFLEKYCARYDFRQNW